MGKNLKGKKKTYHMGRSFTKYRGVAYILCSAVVVVFFFIYGYVFPGIGSELLLAIFGVIELVMLALIKKGGDWVMKNYYYEVDAEGLTIVTGKNRMHFPWKDFSSVRMNNFNFTNFCPFEYVVGGRKLPINQYLENQWDLNCYIMDHIRDYAEVPEELYRQAELMR